MRTLMCRSALVALASLSLVCAADPGNSGPPETRPNGKGDVVRSARPSSGKTSGSNGIFYHGGPLLTQGVNVYYIWYGNWSDNLAKTILTDLANGIGGSSYFAINTTYYDGSNHPVQNAVNYKGSFVDNYSQGAGLSDSQVQAVVKNAIGSGKLPLDKSGVYFVLTSSDVKETSGFCKTYCGWHTYYTTTLSGSNISLQYAFVGDPDVQCPTGCEEQTSVSPNGDPGADGMASVIAHELEEATTDPTLTAWYDRRGEENADKCAWTFGITSKDSNDAEYNLVLPHATTTSGYRNFLIQQNWVNGGGGYCAMSH